MLLIVDLYVFFTAANVGGVKTCWRESLLDM